MFKKYILWVITALVILLLATQAQSAIYYAKDSMRICYEIIIPTLFPFFVCSGFLVYSGFGSVLAKAARGIMRPLFNVAPSGAAAFILGIISGYPLGAITAVQLYKCGAMSKSEAERLLSFCSNSGPLFIIGSVGVSVYGKLSYGVILYMIHIAASVITGIFFRFRGRSHHNSPPMVLKTDEKSISESFSAALRSSVESILTVCFSIIFFSTVSRTLLGMFSLPPLLDAAASGLCEFSTGVLKTSALDTDLYAKLIITSFIVGFSGICVHIQVMTSVYGSGLSLKPYIFGKILHGFIAAVITAAVFSIYRPALSVFSPPNAVMSGAFTASSMMVCISAAAAAAASAIVYLTSSKGKE